MVYRRVCSVAGQVRGLVENYSDDGKMIFFAA